MLLIAIGTLVTIILITILIIKGYFFLLATWLGAVYGLALLGWLATIIIKPRYPKWWERNIARDG